MWLKMDLQEPVCFSESRPFFHVSIPSELPMADHQQLFTAHTIHLILQKDPDFVGVVALDISLNVPDHILTATMWASTVSLFCFSLHLWFSLLKAYTAGGATWAGSVYLMVFMQSSSSCSSCVYTRTSEGCLLPCFCVQPAVWQNWAISSYVERVFSAKQRFTLFCGVFLQVLE